MKSVMIVILSECDTR